MKAGEIFVGGAWRPTASGATYQPINPANEEPLAAVGKGDERDIDLAVTAARKAFDEGPWPRMSPHERGRIVWRLGELIQQHLDEMAKLESLCTGKTMFDSGKVEIPFAAEVFRYYAGWATKIHGETLRSARQRVHLHAAPAGRRGRRDRAWNFPFLLSSWKLAPALAAGNTVVLKPASQTPLTALSFAELCQEAGLPEGVVNVVTGPGGKVGMALVRDPARRQDRLHRLDRGRQGRSCARRPGTLKRLSLELGGKSPNIVFADADMDAAVRGAMTGIFYNKGEVCAAGSRLFLEQTIHDEFVSKLTDQVQEPQGRRPDGQGHAHGPGRLEGPDGDRALATSRPASARAPAWWRAAARASVGNGKGYFVEPTIFDGVTQRDDDRPRGDLRPRALRDPVPVDGGGASPRATTTVLRAGRRRVDARRRRRRCEAAKAIRAGTVWVNAYNVFDAALPFGGFKKSGFGREMGSVGLDNYTEVKTVWVDLA